jgi:hypothetical protein
MADEKLKGRFSGQAKTTIRLQVPTERDASPPVAVRVTLSKETERAHAKARAKVGVRMTPATAEGPLTRQYDNVFPRLLNAVTTMAKSKGKVSERLAWVVHDVAVFHEDSMPPNLVGRYREFCDIVGSGKVPEAYQRHLDPAKSTPAYWLHPRKAARAAELLTEMFETVAYRRGWTEGELAEVDAQEAAGSRP